MRENAQAVESQLISELASFTLDPLGCVRYSFEWGKGDLEAKDGPYPWQEEVLDAIGKHLRSDRWFDPLKIAISSGRGIGKSAFVGMVSHWAMSTCEDARIIVTANTEAQLASKTWPEICKWFRRSINRHWWDQTATRIFSKDPEHANTWRLDRETWSVNNVEAFRGLHNLRKRFLFIFDEAAGIPEEIWRAAEGSMTDEDTEMIFLAFSNPSQPKGAFFECFGRLKHRWFTKQIDSRTVPGTNLDEIKRWIEDWGEDHDYVRINVKGEFPRSGSAQFIASDKVAAARKYKAEGYEPQPKILAVDVARFGDDQTVIGLRQGRKFRLLAKLRGLSTVQVAERVIEFRDAERPDAVVVDGDGIGAGVIDQLQHRGYGKGLFEFHGGATPSDTTMYFNKRAEVWGATRDWINAGAEIPDDPELETDLTGPEYYFSNKNQIQLEKKDDMKSRGLSSPDCGDCLAMTFAVKVAPKPKAQPSFSPNMSAGGWMA